VKALFVEIRSGAYESVARHIDNDPSLVHAVAKSPPKKDDGQSTLQVAIKSGNFDVAHLLLDRGADVNFIDSSAINRWNVPVLHDALRAAVFSTRFGRNRALPGEPRHIEIMNTADDFERAFGLLTRMIASGADSHREDSMGNPALMRAVLDARQVVEEPLLPELEEDLARVFGLLRDAGADFEWSDPRTGQRISDTFAAEPVGRLLDRG